MTPAWLDERLDSLRIDVAVSVAEVIKHLGLLSDRPEDAAPSRPETYLTTKEAAKYLRMEPKAVREGAARGEVPGHKYPPGSRRGQWRFKRRELDRWLKKGERKPTREGLSIWD